MRKFTKTMAAVLSLTMTLTMVTPVFAEGETNITPAQTTEVVTPTPTPAQPPKNGLFVNEGKTYCYKNGKLVKNKYVHDFFYLPQSFERWCGKRCCYFSIHSRGTGWCTP